MDDRYIDLVYTWCDAADAVWRAKKDATAAACGLSESAQPNAAYRFFANDEIRYSLRSAERCVPWIRRVFFVIDDDISPPAWLRLDHPKLQTVRLSEILPPDRLPCFCSGTIEHHLAYIPGLAERFVYSNDDCMFYRPLRPSFFFARDGYPYFRFGGRHDAVKHAARTNYHENLDRADELIRSRYPRPSADLLEALSRYPHHCIDAYVKSDMMDAYARFRAELEPTFAHPFRSPDKVQRVVYAYDAIARGHGHFRLARFRTEVRRPWYKCLFRPGYADSLSFVREKWRMGPAMLKKWKPGVFCFNDTVGISDADRKWVRGVYEELFPGKSSFEK